MVHYFISWKRTMGVEYFGCDGCERVMNDAGGDNYYTFDYTIGKQSFDGVFCQECTKRIREDLTPCLTNYHVLFVLKTKNVESFYVLQSVDKESLKLLTDKLKTADMACCVGTVDKNKKESDVWLDYKKENDNDDVVFEVPEKTYSYFLDFYLKEQADYDDADSWFDAPNWPDIKAKKRNLQSTINRLEITAATIHNEIQVKKSKLIRLEAEFP